VAGDPADPVTTPIEECGQGEEAGGDNEWLGDRGVANGVCVRHCAVRDQVDSRGIRDRTEVIAKTGLAEPGLKESGGLGTLAGADNDDHVSSLLSGGSSSVVLLA
jgi:hypothetical protein